MFPVFSIFLPQERASADEEHLSGGLLHEAHAEPADRRALRRLISGALGLPDDAEDQRKDQQPLEDVEV